MPGYGPLLTALLSFPLCFALALCLSLFPALPVLKTTGFEVEASLSGQSSRLRTEPWNQMSTHFLIMPSYSRITYDGRPPHIGSGHLQFAKSATSLPDTPIGARDGGADPSYMRF
jgi:hypothetical protein